MQQILLFVPLHDQLIGQLMQLLLAHVRCCPPIFLLMQLTAQTELRV